jgi:hypothetical protein
MTAVLPIIATLSLGGAGLPGAARAAGDANMSGCPAATEGSPGFRGFLPECRAYELVTPPYTEGFPITIQPALDAFDGSRLLFNSFGAFAETGGDSGSAVLAGGALYEATRGEGGWRSVSLEPAVSQGWQNETPQAYADLSSGAVAERLWNSLEPGARVGLYIREADGGLKLVGPLTPFAGNPEEDLSDLLSVEGAAANLDTLALQAVTATSGASPYLWPGDTTAEGTRPTLYEYDLSEPGVGAAASEPKLVAVSNEGPLKSNAEASLISPCGAKLAAAEGRGNAVSQTGESVFFVAERAEECGAASGPTVTELDARMNGARTVAISEPTAQDCGACLAGAERERAEHALAGYEQAAFVAASESGESVIFTSYQELLPGVVGRNLYRYDFDARAGERLQLVSAAAGGSKPGAVAVESAGYRGVDAVGDRLYYVAAGPVQTSPGVSNEANGLGQRPVEGEPNLYFWEAPEEGRPARTAFVASAGAETAPLATPGGEFAVFETAAKLTPGDTSTVDQIFEYDAATGALTRVSVGDAGYNDDGNSEAYPAKDAFLSENGQHVFFMSADALTPGALNGSSNADQNVYEYTWSGPQPEESQAHVYLISDGQAGGEIQPHSGIDGALLIGIDPSGGDVFFETDDDLVPQDSTTQTALYDARVDGGFPAPAPPVSCAGSLCQGGPYLAPALASPPSASQPAGGNLPPSAGSPVHGVRVKRRPPTRAQRLATALSGCRKKHNARRRALCVARARQRYGAKAKAGKRATGGAGR